MRGYKLLSQRKNGSVGPLFINKRLVLRMNEWFTAENHPTKGFKERPGWHIMAKKDAPHLSKKNRVWAEVEFEDYTEVNRPASQGGLWYLAERMRVVKIFLGNQA